MISFKEWVVLSLLFFIFFSCVGVENQIEVKDFEEHVVINGLLEAGRNPVVHVSRTSADFNNPIAVDDDAMVILYENGEEAGELTSSGNGEYLNSQVSYKEGQRYGLIVETNGESFFVEETIPTPREIYKVEYIADAGRNMDNWPYQGVKIYISNDPSQELFFNLSIFERGGYGGFTRRDGYVMEFPDTLFAREGLDIPVFSNENVLNDTLVIQLNYSITGRRMQNDSIIYSRSPVFVELNTISKDYYNYLRSVALYEQGRFSAEINSIPPVFNLYSNIENGRGIFAGFSTTRSDTIIP